jgi:hypothetical protein
MPAASALYVAGVNDKGTTVGSSVAVGEGTTETVGTSAAGAEAGAHAAATIARAGRTRIRKGIGFID